MAKIHYDKNTGDVIQTENLWTDDTPTIEATDEELDSTYVCEWGTKWVVRDGRLELVEDTEITSTTEYKRYVIEKGMSASRSYLSDTDYVISKLNELKLEDEDEYETAKAEYSEVLAKRKEARKRINELEAELEALE